MGKALRARYLEAMGIEVWRSNNAPTVATAEPPNVEGTAASAMDAEDLGGRKLSSPGVIPLPRREEGDECANGPQGGNGLAGLDWSALQATVKECRACPLHEARTNTVFGVGNPGAQLLIVGEAPGADEDRQGEPFVGRAGKLLDIMLASIGLNRDRVFIANTIKCRPPGNRDPHPEESLRCRPYLLRQIELIQPTLILAIGRVAAQNLLQRDDSLGRLRGQLHHFGPHRIPMIVSYHPAYLLRSPDQKGKAWQDLQRVATELRREQR